MTKTSTDIKLNDDGIPVCPTCGEVRWGECTTGEIYQDINVCHRSGESWLEWGISEPSLDGGSDPEIFCRECGTAAPQEVADLIYKMLQ